nr:hypothetical protein [Tanacetum cinerariifolium]
EELSDIGSPRADDYEHLMLPEMLEDPYVEVSLQAPPSPDYIPGPEEPKQAPPSPDYIPEDPYVEVALQAPPSPDYIPGPEEPEQAPPSPNYVLGLKHADDEIVAEDQPYAEFASPIAQSPEYVLESDFEAHPEDDDDEDPEEDLVDYLANGGDDGDDEDEEESSEDDEDDEMDIEADEEEEEEHPAPANSIVVALTAANQAPSAKETEPFETDESAATPPPHPAYRRTARISIPAPVPMLAWTDSEAASTSSPPLQLPSASHREDRPKVTLPPRKRLDIALGLRYEVGESSSAAAARPAGGLRADYGFVATVDREIMCDPEREVGYGITDSWDEIVKTLQGAPVSTDTKLGGYDRRAHAYTRHLMETEARMSREAWVRATDASDLVYGKEIDCDFRVAEDRSYEIYRDFRVKDSPTRIGDSTIGTGDSFAGTCYHITGTKQMAPKRTTRSTADKETINATSVANAYLLAMIDQGVTAALAARDALRSMNGDDSHNFGIGVRRTER